MDSDRRSSSIIGLVLAAVCLVAAILGYAFGDPGMILQKAASVCLECIGVG